MKKISDEQNFYTYRLIGTVPLNFIIRRIDIDLISLAKGYQPIFVRFTKKKGDEPEVVKRFPILLFEPLNVLTEGSNSNFFGEVELVEALIKERIETFPVFS